MHQGEGLTAIRPEQLLQPYLAKAANEAKPGHIAP